jgi:putative ABC transport system permease protein
MAPRNVARRDEAKGYACRSGKSRQTGRATLSPMHADLRHLSRSLRRSATSALAAMLTLALTLGAGASIFAIVDAVLLSPPPVAHPESLVVARETAIDQRGADPRALDYATFEAWRLRAGSLARLEAFDGTNLTLTELGPAERVSATDVTPGFLDLLGVAPARGRSFNPDDVGEPVILVSDAFWRAKLAADPAAVGRRIVLGGRPHTIVGILHERFFFALNTCDIWRPLPITRAAAIRTGYRVHVVGRLAPNASPAFLQSALEEVSRGASPPAHAVVDDLTDAITNRARTTLRILAAAAALALLIAFANLAGLLIVRSIDRRRELAVRCALGASHSEIARQLLIEAEALVILGAAGGLLLALWTTPVAARLAAGQLGSVANRPVSVSWRVAALVAGVAAACAAVSALLPMLSTMHRNIVDVLRGGATAAPRELIVRRAFVSAEVAIAFVLLISLALVGRSLAGMLAVNPGFEARGVLTASVSLPAARYPSIDRTVSFYASLQDALDARLGSGSIAIVDELPLTGDRGRTIVRVQPGETEREAVLRVAGSGYFDVMRIRITAGRAFERRDDRSAPMRAVVSESLAERLFGSASSIGRRILVGAASEPAEVIGVVSDVTHRALDETAIPTLYLSAWQSPSRSSHVIVRNVRPDGDAIAVIREEAARLDRDLPVYDIRRMIEVVAASPGVPARRLMTATFIAFALLAVVLGALGLFGVVAHDVASRSTELALRIALGAEPARIVGDTLAQGAAMIGGGLIAGGVLAAWAVRALSSVLYGTRSLDMVNVGVPAVILIAAGLAAVLPTALRAARTDPSITLRGE